MAAWWHVSSEQVAGWAAERRGEALKQVEFYPSGLVVFEIVDRGLSDADELCQLGLGQSPFVSEGLDAEV